MTEQLHTRSEDRFQRLKLRILSAAGLLIPLLASIPPLAAWGGLMTIPFIVYIFLVIGNMSGTVIEVSDIVNIAAYLIALILLVYSIVYLWRRKAVGLVTKGPYRFVRHPQYFSIIVFTAVVTYQSVWILQHTFGFGWLTVDQTIAVWVIMLFAYAVIATIEELHLQRVYGADWIEYRNKVGFLIPFVRFRLHVVEAVICMAIPTAVLYVFLYLTA